MPRPASSFVFEGEARLKRYEVGSAQDHMHPHFRLLSRLCMCLCRDKKVPYVAITVSLKHASGMFLEGDLVICVIRMQAYPLDLVRTRFAAQTTKRYYKGINHALRTIVRDEGLRGLYRGLGATLMQVAPSLAINYTAYGTLRSAWLERYPPSPGVGTVTHVALDRCWTCPTL
jgi:hypothetical protein